MAILKTNVNNIVVGSPHYMSPTAHEGKAQSEIDDMISLGYVFIELSLLYLPWLGLNKPECLTWKHNWNEIIVSSLSNQIIAWFLT